jgi:hypothetical protein
MGEGEGEEGERRGYVGELNWDSGRLGRWQEL